MQTDDHPFAARAPSGSAPSGSADPGVPRGGVLRVGTDAEARMAAFIEACSDPDAGRFAQLVAQLRCDGVPDEALLDHMLPEAARALGAAWAEDRLSFADVTIGCARLQGLLTRAEAPGGVEPAGPGVVLCAMPGAQHTLGALLAASQLRRAGASVRLAMGTRAEIAATVRASRPALVAVSAPAGADLGAVAALADALRGAMEDECELAVGGSLVTAPGVTPDGLARIAEAAGADHVGADILGVAARCGLIGPASARESRGARGPAGGAT